MNKERPDRIGSCVACGHCSYICPAAHFERNFTPRRMAEKFVLHGSKGLDLWSCLTCHACVEVCPEGVDFPRFIRRVREEREAPDIPVRTHAGIMEAMRGLDSSGKGAERPNDWLQPGLEVDDGSNIAVFVGCLPLLDIVFKDVAPNLTDLANAAIFMLNRIGTKPRLLNRTRCCGHDAYWLGERDTFEKMARHNIEVLVGSGISEVITVCPECSHTIGTIYVEEYGPQPFKVRHISQVLAEAIKDGRIQVEKGGVAFTYQDPCRLGRMSKVFSEPRKMIESVGTLMEMPRHGELAACCGSTCFKNCDFIVKKWQAERLDEARSTGADVLATACPKCLIHLGCAQKDFGTYKDRPKIPLKDATVLLAERMGWKR